MKKFLVLGVLALSVASFAKNNGMGNNMNSRKNGNAAMVCPVDGTTMTRGAVRIALTPEQQKFRAENAAKVKAPSAN